MEYKVIIQENLSGGDIYIHDFPLAPDYIQEAMRFRALAYHCDCVFILEYSLN